MSPILDVVDLRRRFGSLVAVDGVSFSVAAGEIFGLLGPNGAGKSTTMRMISGVQPWDSGAVTLVGKPVEARSKNARRLLGVVPQNLAIYPDLTAEENLSFFGSLYDLDGHQLRQRVDDVLTRVGLIDRRDSAAREFSGGMKRRLNFAAAILHQPQLLILDEPTVGVDPQSRNHLLECVRELSQQGTAVIYASHYMEEVEAICSRVAVMDRGRILRCDTLEQLMSQVPREVELVIARPDSTRDIPLPAGTTSEITAEGRVLRITDDRQDAQQMTRRLAEVMQQLSAADIPLHNIRTHESSLERLFLGMTGTTLRD